jgi:UDP-N-acetylglucosamine diphosphorylase/glucosamine-1-phosphate N-acetyltransferase
MNLILFDHRRENLYPFAYTRPIADFRCGILTLKEKWQHYLPEVEVSYLTEDYLSEKYPANYEGDNWYVNAALLPDPDLITYIKGLKEGVSYHSEGFPLFLRCGEKYAFEEINQVFGRKQEMTDISFSAIFNVWDIFQKNGWEIEKDFKLLTEGKISNALDAHSTLIGDKSKLFIAEGAKVNASILNTTTGPIYLGKDSEIMEGSVVRGALALGEHATLKLSSKVYGPTTVGPHSKVGGEVNNSVIFGYSNKGHDGFLGNSVLGEWCNLGADTNVSNLKNNYAEIKLWNYEKNGFKNTGLQFCGLLMGDHSKSGINTMFNTATVVGVSANIYGGGFPRSFIPSFAWGGSEKWQVYRFDKAMETAAKVMERRNVPLNELDLNILKQVFEKTSSYRRFS